MNKSVNDIKRQGGFSAIMLVLAMGACMAFACIIFRADNDNDRLVSEIKNSMRIEDRNSAQTPEPLAPSSTLASEPRGGNTTASTQREHGDLAPSQQAFFEALALLLALLSMLAAGAWQVAKKLIHQTKHTGSLDSFGKKPTKSDPGFSSRDF